MKTVEILGANRFETYTKSREGSRAIDMFSKHESYAEESEEKRGSYQREYMALFEYMAIKD